MGPAIIIIGVILMVVIHELGHFVAAKFFDMKATEAFWGFGPKLWSTTRGETEYGVKALPLGGYVRIVGMSPLEEVDPDEEHRTYRAKPFYQKTIVVLAGIASHFVVALVLLFIGIFTFGSSFVGEVDALTRIAGVTDVLVTPNAPLDEERPIRILRNDEVIAVDGVPIADIDPNATKPRGEISTVEIRRDGRSVMIDTTDLVRPTPARIAGIEAGDVIVEYDGIAISSWEDFVELIHDQPGEARPLVIDRDGVQLSYRVPLTTNVLADGSEVGYFGVSPEVVDRPLGFGEKIGLVFSTLFAVAGAVVQGIWELVSGLPTLVQGAFDPNADLSEARPVSVIGLVRLAGPVEDALTLLTFVNIFVGMLNLVPLYPLDGGHFAVAAYERIAKRPANMRVLMPIAATVFLFLVVLGVFSIVLDIVNPIRL